MTDPCVEAVARAICKARCVGSQKPDDLMGVLFTSTGTERTPPYRWQSYSRAAEAAIAAMHSSRPVASWRCVECKYVYEGAEPSECEHCHCKHFANIDRTQASELVALKGEIERLKLWREGGTLFDALCTVRRRNAGDFSGRSEHSGIRGEAYDKAVLDCFAEIEKALTVSPEKPA